MNLAKIIRIYGFLKNFLYKASDLWSIMQKATLTKALNIASKDILTDEAILNKGIFEIEKTSPEALKNKASLWATKEDITQGSKAE